MAWARTYLKNIGVITNSAHGVWALTPRGSEIEAVDPQAVVRFVNEQSVRERQGRATTPTQIPTTEATTETVESGTTEDETSIVRETLIRTLLSMPPEVFERLCRRLLRESGFTQVEVTGRSGEGG